MLPPATVFGVFVDDAAVEAPDTLLKNDRTHFCHDISSIALIQSGLSSIILFKLSHLSELVHHVTPPNSVFNLTIASFLSLSRESGILIDSIFFIILSDIFVASI